jgi:hypothetical protein
LFSRSLFQIPKKPFLDFLDFDFKDTTQFYRKISTPQTQFVKEWIFGASSEVEVVEQPKLRRHPHPLRRRVAAVAEVRSGHLKSPS